MNFTPRAWTVGYVLTAADMIDLEKRLAGTATWVENVKGPTYNATGNGSTDDATAIQSALTAANAAGGGIVYLPPGTYIIGTTLQINSNVYLVGAGKGATTIKLKNSTNTNMIKTVGFDGFTGTNANNGPSKFGICSLTLDGNKANNLTSGHGIQIYGKDFTMDDFDIQNCRQKGLYTEWYTGGDRMEARVSRFKIADCVAEGMHLKGPHDSVFSNGQVIRCGTTQAILSELGYALYSDIHVWGGPYATAWKIQATGSQLKDCITEGGSSHQLWIDAPDVNVIGGRHFGTGASDTSTCLRIGDTTTSAFPSRCIIKTELGNSQSLVNFNREGGNNTYELTFQTVASGTPMSGLPHWSDKFVGIWDNGAGNASSSIRQWSMFPSDIISSVTGAGYRITEGTNATAGVATLVAGTVTVNTTKVSANSRIFLTAQNTGGTPGALRVSARTAGTSFTITSSSGTDTSQVAWWILEPTGF